jgi:hypothetical protein
LHPRNLAGEKQTETCIYRGVKDGTELVLDLGDAATPIGEQLLKLL